MDWKIASASKQETHEQINEASLTRLSFCSSTRALSTNFFFYILLFLLLLWFIICNTQYFPSIKEHTKKFYKEEANTPNPTRYRNFHTIPVMDFHSSRIYQFHIYPSSLLPYFIIHLYSFGRAPSNNSISTVQKIIICGWWWWLSVE